VRCDDGDECVLANVYFFYLDFKRDRVHSWYNVRRAYIAEGSERERMRESIDIGLEQARISRESLRANRSEQVNEKERGRESRGG